jgi:CheY-like chemotaxis protein
MRTALLICPDNDRSQTVIRALEPEHNIWHVARQRDAMAYLKNHQPETVVLDLDFLKQDVVVLLEAIRISEVGSHALVIGLSKSPEKIPIAIAEQLDQVATEPQVAFRQSS